MSTIHFTSDLHYYHKNICRYSGRPFSSVEEMNEALIDNHNKVVKPGDTVYNLGDISFGSYEDSKNILRRLNGNIHIVWGNHDKTLQANVSDLIKSDIIKSAQHYLEINYNRQHFVLFHFAMRTWNRAHHGSIHTFGHSHNSLPPFGKSADVGVDSTVFTTEYRPISVDEVMEFMNNQKFEVVDHHGD